MELRRLNIVSDDPDGLSRFYEHVFDLERIGARDGTVFLSDGHFMLALSQRGPGQSPGLAALGFQRADVAALGERAAANGIGRPDSDVEFRDPDGNFILARSGAFPASEQPSPIPIRHVALYTADPGRLSEFYCRVLGMREIQRSDRSSIFVSDGYFNLALLYQRKEERLGYNHFGFHVRSNEEMLRRVEQAGSGRGARRPSRIPFAEFRIHDPEGNGIDLSERGWRA